MKTVDVFLIVAAMSFGASVFYAIGSSLHNINVSAFRIGCANAGATLEVVEQCRALAEQKVGYGLFR